jgi:hypothetical protein
LSVRGLGGADPLSPQTLADERPRHLAPVTRAGRSSDPVDLAEIVFAEAEVQKA